MHAEELEKYFHGPAGYLGPVGLAPKQVVNPGSSPLTFSDDGDLIVIVDHSLEGRKNMVCGANKLDYHLRNVDARPRFRLDSHRRHSQRE